MKINKYILVAFCTALFLSVDVYAQSPNYKNGISFKRLFLDYQSQNGGSISDFKSYHSGFEIGYHRKISDNLFINIPFKAGVVRHHNSDLDNCLHKSVYGLDAKANYVFNTTSNIAMPYLLAGIGAVTEVEGDFNIQIPFGAGLFIQLTDNAFINFQSEYRYSLAENRNNLHHGLGFVFQFSGTSAKEKPMKILEKEQEEEMMEEKNMTDSDGDGLIDEVDLCPQEAGLEEMNGCPDKDGDGIPDYKDNCPNYAGLKAFKGCPDTDGDGLSDNDDECPNMVGPIENKGCPANDRDNDGVSDDIDNCPDEKGSPENNGCPIKDLDSDGIPDNVDRCPNIYGLASASGCPDTDNDGIGDIYDKCPTQPGLQVYDGCPDSDGDGIADNRDKCPTSPGSIDNMGCPEIAKEDREVLDLAMRAVQFDTGKNTLKPESYAVLNQIAEILKRYPDYGLSIEGHTDSTGAASANKSLSQKRAEACYDYIISRGITPRKLSFTGFGEERPIADNSLLSGRALNRRVEFNLVPR